MKFVLKKKVLKTKTNLYSVNQKATKGKKKNEKKRNEQIKVPVLLKKNRIEKFETQNLIRGTATLVLL